MIGCKTMRCNLGLCRFQFSRSNCSAAPSNGSVGGVAAASVAGPSSVNCLPSNFSSAYDVPRNRRSALELASVDRPSHIMQSNDSLNNAERHFGAAKPAVDSYANSPPRTYDYPQAGPAPISMASPVMARREMSNPPQPVPFQSHPPQMLVDPNTGQQYYFPSHHQPIYYHPVVPAPVYYQPPSGYIVTSQPQQVPVPQSPTHSRAVFFRPPAPAPQYSGGYFVEHPPSSNVSVCGAAEPEYFQRSHASRHSMESASSGSVRGLDRKNSRDSMSSSPIPPQAPTTSFAQISMHDQQQQHLGHQSVSHPPVGSKFSTTSSCTSGFASGTSESMAESGPLNTSFMSNRSRPAWWGTTETTTRIGVEEKHSPVHRALSENRSSPNERSETEKTPTHVGPASANESSPGRSSPPDTVSEPTPSKPVMKAIRMDIDLSAPVTPVEKPSPKARASAAAATAFTIAFDDAKPRAVKPVSLQDAARQAPTNRRLMRRSTPAGKPAAPDSESETQDPKQYLFNKMIQGAKDKRGAPLRELDVQKYSAHDIDALSEAGTYVVESKATMSSSQVLGSDCEETDEDDSTSTVSGSFATPSTSAPSSARPVEPTKPDPPQRPSLLTTRMQLLRNRAAANAPSSSAAEKPKPTPPVRPCHRAAATTNTAAPAFRRGDGGRFSMRTGSSNSFNPPTSRNSTGSASARPPFRAGAATVANASKKPAPSFVPPKDTPEMVAWLRRKEYDPRKSAAEARKMQLLKARLLNLTAGGQRPSYVSSSGKEEEKEEADESIFQQNRSMSFHPGAISTYHMQKDQRSNKSHDDLSHVGEEDECASGPSSELVCQVDALTQKCLKSIQLIKLCNQNTLSESVENLLEQVVQPAQTQPEEDSEMDEAPMSETISEQLKRLSSAFDAIQKYFEEQRSGSVSPPSYRRLVSSPSGSTRPRTVGTSRSPPSSRRRIPQ